MYEYLTDIMNIIEQKILYNDYLKFSKNMVLEIWGKILKHLSRNHYKKWEV